METKAEPSHGLPSAAKSPQTAADDAPDPEEDDLDDLDGMHDNCLKCFMNLDFDPYRYA